MVVSIILVWGFCFLGFYFPGFPSIHTLHNAFQILLYFIGTILLLFVRLLKDDLKVKPILDSRSSTLHISTPIAYTIIEAIGDYRHNDVHSVAPTIFSFISTRFDCKIFAFIATAMCSPIIIVVSQTKYLTA